MINYKIFNKYNIKDKSTLVLGISGGPDSMCLLDLAIKYRNTKNINIVVCHIDHNVRDSSKEEKEYVLDFCNKNNIIFESMIIEYYSDDNFENEARNIRYKFFDEIINKYHGDYLLTAHHGDDLIETILMRIVRGSTINGYAGFKEIVNKNNYKIIRPLIRYTKDEIIEYDNNNNIKYYIDQTNLLDIHTRNRYRNTILPFLKKEDKNVVSKFLKFSNLLNSYNEYVDNILNKTINKVYVDNCIIIKEFLELDELIKIKVIEHIFEDIYSDDLILINDRHINLVINSIKSKKSNIKIYLPNDIVGIKEYDKFKIIKNDSIITSYEVELIDKVVLPNGHTIERIDNTEENSNNICRLNSSDITLPLIVRTRKLGDKISGYKMNGSTKVKDIFIDKKIPSTKRDIWPIVVDSTGIIVWIPGIKKSKFNKQKNENSDIIIKYI